LQIFLAAAPEQLQAAMKHTNRLAHAAYRIGKSGRLEGGKLPGSTRGGLLLLSDLGCGIVYDPALLSREIARECAGRGFAGVAADFELPPSRDKVHLLRELRDLMGRSGRKLYLPEVYGKYLPNACILICTALSGGSLQTRLEEAVNTWGKDHIALDLQRLRMVFSLPCPSGCGRPLSQRELEEMKENQGKQTFYSADLCAKYFTCAENGQSRFVLFDDEETLEKKIRIGSSLGIQTGFFMYPEVEDLLPRLFAK